MAVDQRRLEEMTGRVASDFGAALSAALVGIGDRLGLYRALAAEPATPAELAERTGTSERYVREWLLNQAASGYASYDGSSGRYFLREEQRLALADEASPANMVGAFHVAAAAFAAAPRIEQAFRTGEGLAWGEHDAALFEGTERLFAPGYRQNLTTAWIPALDGVQEKLEAGASVADVGCGHGVSTVLMAERYPRSSFVGFDYHAASVERARTLAAEAGVEGRCRFEVASASAYPGRGYDLVTHFDCFHDLGAPLAAARHVRETLAPTGTWMLVEPYAGDRVEDAFTPVGRIFSAASTVICVPCSLAEHGPALGAQAGERRLRELLVEAGFSRVRRATETPFNLVLEARP
jgi:SAM-dependent methyltransferase